MRLKMVRSGWGKILSSMSVCMWCVLAVYAQQTGGEKYEVRGRVVNAVTGGAVANALVQAVGVQAEAQFSVADGTFVFAEMPRGTYQFEASKPGYFSQRELAHGGAPLDGAGMVPGDTEVVLKLTPEGIIYGRVENESGEALEGVEVRAQTWLVVNGTKRLQSAGQAVSDDEGQFRVAELHPGTYYVSFLPRNAGGTRVFSQIAKKKREEEGYGSQFYPGTTDFSLATAVKIRGGTQVQIAQALKRQRVFEVAGVVRGENAENGFQVMLLDSAGEPQQRDIHLDPKSGVFQIPGVPEGKYQLIATVQDFTGGGAEAGAPLTATLPLQLNRDMTGLVLMPGHGATVGVTIEDEIPVEGQEIHQVQISLVSKDAPQSSRGLILAPPPGVPNAQKQFEGLAPGTYEVETWALGKGYVASLRSGDVDLLREDLTVVAGAAVPPIEVKLQDDGATIEIETTESGKLAPSTVVLYSEEYPKKSVFLGMQTGGNTAMRNLRPGPYKVVAIKGLQDLEYQDPAFVEKYVLTGKEVNLRAGEKVSVSVEVQELQEESSQ
jgi:hypothetical protein